MDNFKTRTVKKGPPTPPSPNFVTHHKANAEHYTAHLFISQYEQVDWLTGCGTARQLYHWWPFTVFEVWNKHGFSDLNYLSSMQENTQNYKLMCTVIYS